MESGFPCPTLRLYSWPHELVELQIIYLQNSIFDPMIVPPLPWKGNWFGGHLLQHDMVVRLKSTSAQLGSINKADNEIPGLSKVRQPTSAWREPVRMAISREQDFTGFLAFHCTLKTG